MSMVIRSRNLLETSDKRVSAVLWSCTSQGTMRLDQKMCLWRSSEIPLGLLGNKCSLEWTMDIVKEDNRNVLPERRLRDMENNRQEVAPREQNCSFIKKYCFFQGRDPATPYPAGTLWVHGFCDPVSSPSQSVD